MARMWRPVWRSVLCAVARKYQNADPGVGGWNPLSLFSAGQNGALYFPSVISSLFQDAAGTIPVTAPGDPVGLMRDLSGNGRHASQSTPASRPVYQVVNGRGVIRFNGTTQYLEILGSTSTLKFMHDGTGASIFASVALASPLTPSKAYPIAASTISAVAGFGLSTYEAAAGDITSQQMTTVIGNGSATVINGTSSGQGSVRGDGRGQVLGFTYKTQTGNDFRHYTDGNNFNFSRAESNPPTSSNSYYNVQIGHVSSYYLAGDLYQLIMVGEELSAADRRSLVAHQRSLYGDDSFIIGVGDSHTYNTAYGLYMRGFYPALLESALRTAGWRSTSLNYGVSGNTTTQILARMSSVLEQGTPSLAIVYAGQNDVAIDTQANLQSIVASIQAAGCSRVLVCGSHYMNFSSGGDTTSAQDAGYATLRGKQSAAAAASGAAYVDLYAYMRALIVAGTYTQGDDTAWHVAVGNTHLNAVGQQIVADAIFAKMQAQGWA